MVVASALSAARAMKPKASLKSANTKVRRMASRPGTSVHPDSRARASARAGPISFSVIVTSGCNPPAGSAADPITRPTHQGGCAGADAGYIAPQNRTCSGTAAFPWTAGGFVVPE